jgi:hypothetical protein
MTGGSQSKPRANPRRKPAAFSPSPASPQARRQAAAILEVLAGVLRPADASQLLATSLPRYYQLERRALAGLLAACEPALRGPRIDLARRMAALERENRRLKRECDRQQALVRAVERSLGLALSSAAKGPTKPKGAPPGGNGSPPRRRRRRPTVRALKVARSLQAEAETAEGGAAVLSAIPATAET